jgi:protein gp37
MGDKSKIQWTDATWGCVTGCSKVSAGCKNCYAETLTERFRGVPGHYFENGFDIKLRPDKLDLPRRWQKPRMVFVNSLSDIFHKDIPLDYVKQMFKVMNECPQHTFQILTKRHERMLELANEFKYSDNIWLGVSVEDNNNRERIEYLKKMPAKTKFLSLEPLIGPIYPPKKANGDFDLYFLKGINWCIIGGESGPGARPMDLSWIGPIIGLARNVGAAVFIKQMGSVLAKELGLKSRKGEDMSEWHPAWRIREFPNDKR